MVSQHTSDQLFLHMKEDPENGKCVDCGIEDPEYVSLEHGVFICDTCSCAHLGLGYGRSTIKSKSEPWTIDQLKLVAAGGNSSFKNFFDHYKLPAGCDSTFKYQTMAGQYYRALLFSAATSTQCNLALPSDEEGLKLDNLPHFSKQNRRNLESHLNDTPPNTSFLASIYAKAYSFRSKVSDQYTEITHNPKVLYIEDVTKTTAHKIGDGVKRVYDSNAMRTVISKTKAAANFIGHEAAEMYQRINHSEKVQSMKGKIVEFLERAEVEIERDADKIWTFLAGTRPPQIQQIQTNIEDAYESIRSRDYSFTHESENYLECENSRSESNSPIKVANQLRVQSNVCIKMNKYRDYVRRPLTASQSQKNLRSPRPISSRPNAPSTPHSLTSPLSRPQTARLFTKPPTTPQNRNTQVLQVQSSFGFSQTIPIESPNNSIYSFRINLPRPQSGTLSTFTERENKRMKRSERLISLPLDQMNFSPIDELTELKASIPKDRDFVQLIDRFDKIAQNKSQTHKKLLINEATTLEELMIVEGDNQYIRVMVRGKKCPLRVNIKRKKGRLETYVSRTIPEPNDELCDACYKKDKFLISDTGLKFRVEMVYFCLHAVTDSILTFSVGFGPERRDDGRNYGADRQDTYLDFKLMDEAQKEMYRKKAEKAIKRRQNRALQLSKYKNFVKSNKKMQEHTSPGRQTKLTSKKQLLEERIKTANTRKSQIVLEKKERTLILLRRREIRLEAEEKFRQRQMMLMETMFRQREWLILMNFIYTSKIIEQSVKLQRSEILEKLTRSTSARQIQRYYFRLTGGLRGQQLIMLRARNLLTLQSMHIRSSIQKKSDRQLILFIRDHYKINQIPMYYSKFTEQILLIQKVWRVYQVKQKERFQHLIQLWDKTLQEVIEQIIQSEKVTKSRKGRKSPRKESQAAQFMRINQIARNFVLAEYFRECKRRYRALLKTYVSDNKRFLNIGVRAFLSRMQKNSDTPSLMFTTAPDFKYVPTFEMMKQLMEKAINF